MDDKIAGQAKEAWGAITGDEAKKEEGRAQQRKGEARQEAEKRQRANEAKKEARQAERERDREKVKDEGLLGGISDALSSDDDRRRGRR